MCDRLHRHGLGAERPEGKPLGRRARPERAREDERDALEEWASNLNHWFGAEEGHQLLGYPHSWRSDVLVQNVVMWREDLATALAWRNLLAFETDEAAKMQWADGGHCWFLIEHVALEAGELERARATAQLG